MNTLSRNYDSDFSATDVKSLLNSIACEGGSTDLKTPFKTVEPMTDYENRFEVETRPTAGDDVVDVLGVSGLSRDGFRFRVLGTDVSAGTAQVQFESD